MAHAHLLETGRRRIAFVNGPADTAPGRARSEGYQQACAATGSHGIGGGGRRLHGRRRRGGVGHPRRARPPPLDRTR